MHLRHGARPLNAVEMRRRARLPRFAGVVLAITAGYLLFLSVPNVIPSVRAARADGTPGVFTAQRLDCVRHPGHESCSWTGEFRSDDGRFHRTRVSLHGGDRQALRPGTQIAAVDIGRARKVYGPEGSREWMATALLVLIGAGMLAYLAVRSLPVVILRLGRRRTRAERVRGAR